MNKTKVKTIAMWTLTTILGAMIMIAGASKFGETGGWAERFAGWGYAPWFLILIGVAEIAGGIGLFIPKTALLAAYGLVIIMLGALATHLLNGEVSQIVGPLIYLAFLSGIILMRKKKMPVPVIEAAS